MSTEKERARARERAHTYYYANKERYLERGRAWRFAHKEKGENLQRSLPREVEPPFPAVCAVIADDVTSARVGA